MNSSSSPTTASRCYGSPHHMQTPPTQLVPRGHLLPHPLQLFGSLNLSTQVPPQQLFSWLLMSQTWLHVPQFLRSVARSTHFVKQQFGAVLGQTLRQAPQLERSRRVSMQIPLQISGLSAA